MTQYMVKSLACLLLMVLDAQGIPVLPPTAVNGWNEPTEEQRQEAVANRLPLSIEEEYMENSPISNACITRYYTNVQLTTCRKNDTYNPIGYVTDQGTGGAPVTLEYAQGATKTTQWEVTGNISGKEEIRELVMAEIEEMLGVSVGMSTTTTKSSTVIAAMTVPAYQTGTIYAYHSAAEIQGTILWQDADESGTVYATGREKIGGAFPMHGIYLENEVTEGR